LALLWSVVVEGFRPDRYDLLGAVVGAWSWSLPLEVSVPLFYGPRGGIILRNPLRSSAL
jgi:drug/metabolite transporter superfamily protein YnfA